MSRFLDGADGDTTLLRSGDVFADKYVIGQLIGRGGMGVVYAAHHMLLDQAVALKLLSPRAAVKPTAVTRFVNEARLAARIKTEHVCRVMDIAMQANGMPYIAMEFLDGTDLETLLRARGPLPPGEAVHYVMQALDALAHAHTAGVIHRDLKPSNLFLARIPERDFMVKVLDFGISKLESNFGEARAGLTTSDTILGSPAYMAPEQIVNSRNCTLHTDIWSIGVILYELMTGKLPFPGETAGEAFAKILREDPEPMRGREKIPAELEKAIMRCLHKDREQRFGSVLELAQALRPFAPLKDSAQLKRIQLALEQARVSKSLAAPGPSASKNLALGTTVSAVHSPAITEAPGAVRLPLRTRNAVVGGIAALIVAASAGIGSQLTSGTPSAVRRVATPALAGAAANLESPTIRPILQVAPPSSPVVQVRAAPQVSPPAFNGEESRKKRLLRERD